MTVPSLLLSSHPGPSVSGLAACDEHDLSSAIDGFWLPRQVRDQVLSAATHYAFLSFADGRPCEPGDAGAVTAKWPVLEPAEWRRLLACLRSARQRAPSGREFWARLQAALLTVGRRLADPLDPLHLLALAALPGYTGYSEPMIRLALGAIDLVNLDQLPAAFALTPTVRAARGWQCLDGLPGRLRCYPASRGSSGSALRRLLGWGLGGDERPLFGSPELPELVVGYGAGNVPGTALLIAFLAMATTLAGGSQPAVVVKNSRREPIFSPLVLGALESVDPDLVSCAAVMIWDYEDQPVQQLLLSQAGLVIAAASDETIAQIGRALQDTSASANSGDAPHAPRFHAHGHKVSFSAIGREVLAHGLHDPLTLQPVLDIAATLAALDSAIWDQHGCLSSRVHFVEIGGDGHHSPLEYAARLAAQLRLVGSHVPRGAWPRSQIYDRFDRYKLLEMTGQVQVVSEYGQEFLVAVDQRPWADATTLQQVVNDCQGRVIIVRPVADLLDLPDRYLRLLPAANLQSLSVATGRHGETLTDRFLRFAGACGECGVTAIRTVGRAAFPQLAYSWDGLIPLDLVHRPVGRFTTIEFDTPYDQMLETYHTFVQRGMEVGA
jgi:Acyl-CoA reductase (LuxC)